MNFGLINTLPLSTTWFLRSPTGVALTLELTKRLRRAPTGAMRQPVFRIGEGTRPCLLILARLRWEANNRSTDRIGVTVGKSLVVFQWLSAAFGNSCSIMLTAATNTSDRHGKSPAGPSPRVLTLRRSAGHNQSPPW